MPEGAAAAQDRGDQGLWRGHHLPRPHRGRRARLRARVRPGARRGAHPPVRPPGHRGGQGTLGLEVLEQCPDMRTIVIPVGGGGVAAGVTIAVKAASPDVSVVGVQAEAVASYPPSLAAGHPVRVEAGPTMADGIAVLPARRHPVRHPVEGRRPGGDGQRGEPVPGARALPGTGQAGGRAGRRGRGGRPAGVPGHVRAAGGGRAVRRQHRPAAAVQGAPARAGRGLPAT